MYTLIMTMFIIISIIIVVPVWKGSTVYTGAYVVSSYDTTQIPSNPWGTRGKATGIRFVAFIKYIIFQIMYFYFSFDFLNTHPRIFHIPLHTWFWAFHISPCILCGEKKAMRCHFCTDIRTSDTCSHAYFCIQRPHTPKPMLLNVVKRNSIKLNAWQRHAYESKEETLLSLLWSKEKKAFKKVLYQFI